MAGEQKIENTEADHDRVKSDSFTNTAEGDAASGEDGMPSESASSVRVSEGATSGSKGSHVVFPQLDDHGYCHSDGSSSGIQSGNGSPVYGMPGYNQYIRESFMGVDGQFQQPCSSGYPKPTVSYGSAAGPNAKFRANGWNSLSSNGSLAGKLSTLTLDSNSCQYPASSNFSKSVLHSQPHKPLNKVSYVGCDFKSTVGPAKGLQPVGNFSSLANGRQGFFQNNGPMNYRPDNGMGYGSDRYKVIEKSFGNEGSAATGELNRGPRAQKISSVNPSVEKEALGITVQRNQYNQKDFQIQYEMAKFHMIKSYSEDDVHKCIKYNVWASTPNGNKKLDAAFHEAEAKATEKGLKCPIFPVKWHIVKDIPNALLRDIILENNENKAVTYSRDTQEIPV